MKSIWTKLTRTLAAFRIARAGNVAITFALASLPIVGTVGFAVDYSHANSVKVAMQAALDSTALMLSRDAATKSSGDLQTEALNYFNALFTRPEAKDITITTTYTSTGGSSVVVNGSANVPTSFLGIIGYNNIAVTGSSTSKWGSERLRVALVLDNTGSMADNNKITALKSATHGLLTQLQNAAGTNGDVYVSIVPFAKDINVDTSSGSSSWVNWVMWDDGTNSSWDGTNGSCSLSGYSPRSSCVAQSVCSLSGYTTQSTCTGAGTCSLSGNTTQSTCTSAGTCSISGSSHNTQSTCTTGVCSISGKTTQSTCTAAGVCSNGAELTQSNCTSLNACSKSQYTTHTNCTNGGGIWGHGTWTAGVWTAPGTWTAATWTPGTWTAATWTPNDHSTWNGCITDRGNATAPNSANYDQNVLAPVSGTSGSYYPAEQYNACPQPVMGLNYNWTGMSALVDNMTPNGGTNQPVGLVWGWLSLAGGGPLTAPAMDSNYQYKQYIILLSDGLNTQDRWYGNGSQVSTSVDKRMYDSTNSGAGTCANIKAAGITIYTIQVNTAGDPTSTLLQNCASDSTKFFLLTSADAIVTTFNQIGTNLTQLRVAR